MVILLQWESGGGLEKERRERERNEGKKEEKRERKTGRKEGEKRTETYLKKCLKTSLIWKMKQTSRYRKHRGSQAR